jgi:hypothetical protein
MRPARRTDPDSAPHTLHRPSALRRVAAVGAAVVLMTALMSCGSDGGSSGSRASSPSTLLSSDQLSAALLTVDDLPKGWSEDDTKAEDSDLTETIFGEGGAPLCPAGIAALRTETHGTAARSFVQTAPMSTFDQQLSSAPDAESHFSDIEAALSSCVGQTWTDDTAVSASMTMAMEESEGPALADESRSYELTLTMAYSGETTTVPIGLTMVRRSTVVQIYSYGAYEPTGTGSISSPDWNRLIEAGDRRVAAYLADPGAMTPETAAPMTRAEFVAEANSICRATRADVKKVFEADPIGESEDLRLYLYDVGPKVTPLLRQMLSDLRDLPPPAGDEAIIERGWDEMHALVQSLDADPTWLFNQMFPKDVELYRYGLTDCFVDHVDVL